MLKSFSAYYPTPDAELRQLWGKCIIALDANVLLNLYGYSEDTRSQFLNVLKKLGGRLWLPHQVGFEFHQSRIGALRALRNAYEARLTDLRKFQESLSTLRDATPREQAREVLKTLQEQLEGRLAALRGLGSSDYILKEITKVFDGKVGPAFDEHRLELLYREGKERYLKRIPPGFTDSSKPEPDCYGDLIAWKQILAEAQKRKVGVIFVTDERKEDWWQKDGDAIVGPHPLLKAEAMTQANVGMHIYRPDVFYNWAEKALGEKVSPEAAAEIREDVEQRDQYAALLREGAMHLGQPAAPDLVAFPASGCDWARAAAAPAYLSTTPGTLYVKAASIALTPEQKRGWLSPSASAVAASVTKPYYYLDAGPAGLGSFRFDRPETGSASGPPDQTTKGRLGEPTPGEQQEPQSLGEPCGGAHSPDPGKPEVTTRKPDDPEGH